MIGAAVMVGRIATGEIVEVEEKRCAAAELGRKGGRRGQMSDEITSDPVHYSSNETHFDTLALPYDNKTECVAGITEARHIQGILYGRYCVPDDGSTVREYGTG